jgi:hypothetical protein
MDSADKSSNKAQSAAYKYAAMQVFCIPTEGDNDADASHHEVEPRAKQGSKPSAVSAKPSAAVNAAKAAIPGRLGLGNQGPVEDPDPDALDYALAEIDKCADVSELSIVWTRNSSGWKQYFMPTDFATITTAKDARKAALTTAPDQEPTPFDEPIEDMQKGNP